ncbi:MAG TPA: molybdopterin-dependent oxidoreductase [Blastocatellia bacterium]|nr:molybdopterin-dependent oxidoreductase [Blastocatellia bacterium]
MARRLNERGGNHDRQSSTLCHCFPGFALLVVLAAAQTPQATNAPEYQLSVGGEVERELKLSLADLAKLPRRLVRAKGHDGVESMFEGVALIDILDKAGLKFGEGLSGKSLALYLVVEASDGYRVVFALPELDPAYTDRVIILADKMDGAKLSESPGPVRIVVPGEKRQARWVRQVSALIIKRA